MRVDFHLYRGDDSRIDLVRKDQDGNPIDISGFTFWFTAKSDPSVADSEAEIGPVSNNSHDDAANGESHIIIPSSETDNLTEAIYDYDIQEKDAAGKIHTVSRGKVSLIQDVTKAS